MTYFETMLDALKFIVKRHSAAFEKNCSDKVKKSHEKLNKGKKLRIEFVRYQPVEPKKSDYEYLLFEADCINIELRHDLESLFTDLKLYAPEYFNSFPSSGVKGTGFTVRVPNGWMENYKDSEFEEEVNENDFFFWRNWKCPEDKMDERYKHFNEVIERWI